MYEIKSKKNNLLPIFLTLIYLLGFAFVHLHSLKAIRWSTRVIFNTIYYRPCPVSITANPHFFSTKFTGHEIWSNFFRWCQRFGNNRFCTEISVVYMPKCNNCIVYNLFLKFICQKNISKKIFLLCKIWPNLHEVLTGKCRTYWLRNDLYYTSWIHWQFRTSIKCSRIKLLYLIIWIQFAFLPFEKKKNTIKLLNTHSKSS